MTTQVVSPFANSAAGESSFLPSATGPLSSSLKSSSIIPLLRKLDIREDSSSPRQQKKSLLTLKLSAASFLQTSIHDGLSRDPLYTIETLDTSTTVSRCDAWDGLRRTADLRWPKTNSMTLGKGKGRDVKPETLIQMDGRRWISADNLLKYNSISGSWTFVLPNSTHSFKWRRHGSSFQCTTSSMKGPVAMFDPTVESVPARICVFESMLDKRASTKPGSTPKDDLSKQRGGVSILLLDYLVITALLLVTSKEEYATINVRRSIREPTEQLPGPEIGAEANTGTLPSGPVSVKQWRKIVYGEPLFPTLKVPKMPQPPSEDDPGDKVSVKNRPASTKQLRKIMYGEPLFPQSLQSKTSSDDDVDDSFLSGDEDEEDEENEERNEGEEGEEELSGHAGDEQQEEDAEVVFARYEDDDAETLSVSEDGSDSFPYPISPMSGLNLRASMDSIPYPITPISIAPAHGDMDPSFYDESSHVLRLMPPVPEIPSQYLSQNYPARTSSTQLNDPYSSYHSPLTVVTNASLEVPNSNNLRPPMTTSSMPSSYAVPDAHNRGTEPWIQRSKSSPSMNGVPASAPLPSSHGPSSSNPNLARSSRDTGSSSRTSSLSHIESSEGSRSLPAPPLNPHPVRSAAIEKRRSISLSQLRRPSGLRSLPPIPQATTAASAEAQAYLARTLQKEANEHRWQQQAQPRPQSLISPGIPADAPPAYHAIDFSAPNTPGAVGSSNIVYPPDLSGEIQPAEEELQFSIPNFQSES